MAQYLDQEHFQSRISIAEQLNENFATQFPQNKSELMLIYIKMLLN